MRSLTPSTAGDLSGDPRLERLLRCRHVRDPPPGPLGGEVEVLELDEMLKIRMHQEEC